MSNELAASLVEIAQSYVAARRKLPPHLVGDLQDVARADTIAHRLRNEANRILGYQSEAQ